MVTVLLIDRLGRRAAMAIEFALLTASVSLTISLSLQLQSKLKNVTEWISAFSGFGLNIDGSALKLRPIYQLSDLQI